MKNTSKVLFAVAIGVSMFFNVSLAHSHLGTVLNTTDKSKTGWWFVETSGHYVKCECGAEITTQNGTKEGLSAHVDNNKDGKCDGCYYVMSNSSTSSNTSSNTGCKHSYTYEDNGNNHIKKCTKCGDKLPESHLGTVRGAYAGWFADESGHWVKCVCGKETKGINSKEIGKVAHGYNAQNKCAQCGYPKPNQTSTKVQYKIVYSGNGATSGNTASSTHNYGESKTLTVNGYSRTGYSFDGWNTKADGTGTKYSEKQNVKDLCSTNGATATLYAQWKAKTFTVVYHKCGNANVADGITESKVSGTMENSTFTVSKTGESLPANKFSCEGYRFKCWRTTLSDNKTVEFKDKTSMDSFKKEHPNMTKVNLYAVWEKIYTNQAYTITFDNQGATTSGTKTMSVVYGNLISTCIAVPTRSYSLTYDANGGNCGVARVIPANTFGGYYTEKNGEGKQYYNENGSALVSKSDFTEDTTLYAKWISSAPIKLPKAYRQGYTFLGWTDEKYSNVAKYEADERYTINGNVTLYAVWEVEGSGSIVQYTDVDKNAWYAEAVNKNKVTKSVTKDTFLPEGELSRETFVCTLYNMSGAKVNNSKSKFSDVTGNTILAANWASENGIINGYDDDTFKPSKAITRQEAITSLYRYAKYKGYNLESTATLDKFKDADDVYSWAVDPIKWAVGKGVIEGDDLARLNPLKALTRAEAVTMLNRFFKIK